MELGFIITPVPSQTEAAGLIAQMVMLKSLFNTLVLHVPLKIINLDNNVSLHDSITIIFTYRYISISLLDKLNRKSIRFIIHGSLV